MSEITVGSLWTDGRDDEVAEVAAVRDGRVCVWFTGSCQFADYRDAYFRDAFTPHVPPAPEPPLTGEQMAYVLETLASELASRTGTATNDREIAREQAVVTVASRLLAAAKEFRK